MKPTAELLKFQAAHHCCITVYPFPPSTEATATFSGGKTKADPYLYETKRPCDLIHQVVQLLSAQRWVFGQGGGRVEHLHWDSHIPTLVEEDSLLVGARKHDPIYKTEKKTNLHTLSSGFLCFFAAVSEQQKGKIKHILE